MDNDLTTTICFMAARAVHFGACLLILGVWTFDRIVIAAVIRKQSIVVVRFWERTARWLMWLALPAALISGIAWFAFVAINMSGLPPQEALRPPVLRLVWSQTEFGGVWRLRSAFWLASTLAATWIFFLPARGRLRSALIWLLTMIGALLLGSLAWSGHGQFGQPVRWHLLADSLHLVVAALWPTGLLPLTLLLLCLRKTPAPERSAALSLLVNRFSAMSLVSVGMLAATGIVNSCYMLQSVSDLIFSLYGRVLLLKIALFCLMIGIGAFNLLCLKPHISAGGDLGCEATRKHAARLQVTIGAELFLGMAVVLVVALLGLIMPPHM
jgi:putative copper resistance protein D